MFLTALHTNVGRVTAKSTNAQKIFFRKFIYPQITQITQNNEGLEATFFSNSQLQAQ
jgi:hypothetical protein